MLASLSRDAMSAAADGRLGRAAALLFRRSVAQSLGAVVDDAGVIHRLAMRPARLFRSRGNAAAR
jgi:hypothetical protein